VGVCPGPQCGTCGPGVLTCSPCNIPLANLTLSWVNGIIGNGSVALTYNGLLGSAAGWASACSNGLLFKLLCTGGNIELRVIYFTSGSCPTGTQQYCSNQRGVPEELTLVSFTCSPFSLTFSCQSSLCPAITSSGYTQFVATYP
jgi:hypothetical protein